MIWTTLSSSSCLAFLYSKVKSKLESAGYSVMISPLISTGKAADDNSKISMYDDVAATRQVLEGLINQGKLLVLVGHSGGGLVAAHATQGLYVEERKAAGKTGGVVKLAFVTGAIFPVGHEHQDVPFADFQVYLSILLFRFRPEPNVVMLWQQTFKISNCGSECDLYSCSSRLEEAEQSLANFLCQGGKMDCQSPRELLFNDLPDKEAREQITMLSFQPSTGWNGRIQYAGWEEIPSAYMICTKDAAIPLAFQEQMAAMAHCSPIEKCDAGHCPHVSQPDAVAAFLINVAEGAI